ncbi:hypothetical protein D9M71_587460 [compost metagenome]
MLDVLDHHPYPVQLGQPDQVLKRVLIVQRLGVGGNAQLAQRLHLVSEPSLSMLGVLLAGVFA